MATKRKMIPSLPLTAVINATLPTIPFPKPSLTLRNPLDIENHIVDATTTTPMMTTTTTTFVHAALLEIMAMLLLLLAPTDHLAQPVPIPPSFCLTALIKKADLSLSGEMMLLPIYSKISFLARAPVGSILRKSLVVVTTMQGPAGGDDFLSFPCLLVMIVNYDLMLRSFLALKLDAAF